MVSVLKILRLKKDSVSICRTGGQPFYSSCGTFIDTTGFGNRCHIDFSNPFWWNTYAPSNGWPCNFSTGTSCPSFVLNTNPSPDNSDSIGPLKRTGVWPCGFNVQYVWNGGFTVPINIPDDSTYYIGVTADDNYELTIDDTLRASHYGNDNIGNRFWQIFPKYLSKGTHRFKLEGLDYGTQPAMGFEIYHNTKDEVRTATCYENLNLIYSTKDIIGGTKFFKDSACPIGYSQVAKDGKFICRQYADATPGCSQSCPIGYRYSPLFNQCIKDTNINIIDSFKICLIPQGNPSYSSCGSYIYSSFDIPNNNFHRSPIDQTDTMWINSASHSSECTYIPDTVRSSSSLKSNHDSTNLFQSLSSELPPSYTEGPLNRCGVWTCSGIDSFNVWVGFTVPFSIYDDATYLIGMAADNRIRITFDDTLFREDEDAAQNENFKIWHIFPKHFAPGLHTVRIESYDVSGSPLAVGFEIYHNTEAEIRVAQSYSDLNLILSTKDLNGRSYPESYSCPIGYSLADNGGSFTCRSMVAPTKPDSSVISTRCISVITDTLVNPYTSGLLGNFRAYRTHVFYSDRAEFDPSAATNIRNNGAYDNFTPFWLQQGTNFKNVADTNYWVWNSESTLFNKKGFELENKDPLGRYNSGLYGYHLTLPIAVTQNSRYRNSAFEGFEDYNYSTKICDTVCSPSDKQLDFSPWVDLLDTTVSHTGKYSLKIKTTASDNIALGFKVASVSNTIASLKYSTATNTCGGAAILSGIHADSSSLIKNFTPIPGDSLVISGWLKESQDCLCNSYNDSHAIVIFSNSDNSTVADTAYTSGNIIEGWQRFERKIVVPANAQLMTVVLQGNTQYDSYFDDLRIHPYNANMKSFVYDPVNLRLMAELDENNYATFYEYDDDGTPIRVKKETERGIKTISESRSVLSKRTN